MRLLHVIAQLNPRLGGVGEAVRVTVKKLNEFGVYNEIVSLDSPDADFLVKQEVIIHALGPGRTPWCYSAKLIPWLMMNVSGFDAIVLHGLWLFPGFAVRKALQHLKCQDLPRQTKQPRIFIMPHGMLDPYFQQASNRKLKAIRNWLYWKLVERKVVHNANGLLFTCEEELLLARTTFSPYRPQKEIIVGLGISQSPTYTKIMRNRFLESCPGLNNEQYILFLGRIHPKKGVDILVKAYSELLRSALQLNNGSSHSNNIGLPAEADFRNIKFPRLVIAGPGWETAYGLSIKKLVDEDSLLNGFVYLSGMLVDEAKWGAFFGCEAFILPSHQENFGIAVVEALSCGKPVLISNKVNIWREIKASGSGIISEDTQQGTFSALEKWHSLAEEEKENMAMNAKKAYANKFCIESKASQFLRAVE